MWLQDRISSGGPNLQRPATSDATQAGDRDETMRQNSGLSRSMLSPLHLIHGPEE